LHWPPIPAILAAIAICTVLGLAQGFLIAWVRMPAFVVTLGGFLIFEGIAFHILSGATINVFDPFIGALGTYSVPVPIGWAFAIVAAVAVALTGAANRAARARSGLANPPIGAFAVSTIAVAVLLLGTAGLLNAYRGIPLSFAILMVLALAFWYVARHVTWPGMTPTVPGVPFAERTVHANPQTRPGDHRDRRPTHSCVRPDRGHHEDGRLESGVPPL